MTRMNAKLTKTVSTVPMERLSAVATEGSTRSAFVEKIVRANLAVSAGIVEQVKVCFVAVITFAEARRICVRLQRRLLGLLR